LHCSYHDDSPLFVACQGTLCSDSFHVLDVSLVSDLTMQVMSVGQITDHNCRVILDPDFCHIQDRCTDHLVGTDPWCRDSQHLWELDWLRVPSTTTASLASPAIAASSMSSFSQCIIVYVIFVVLDYLLCFVEVFRVCFRSRVFRSLSGLSIGQADSASLSL
jgi:hypothetical protein